ncbi:MAG: SDR family oxidoreductase [Victivallales bacterium]
MKIFDLTGKTALVTGGNGGIGLGMAIGLAAAGAKVAICGRKKRKNANALKKMQEINPECRAFEFDLKEISAIAKRYMEISREMTGIDILINNAGSQCRGRAEDIASADFDNLLKINVTAPFVVSQCFARERIAMKRGGSIIMTASLMSEASRPGTSAYTTSKGAVRQLIKALAVDWAGNGIRVNGIGPGYIKTEMTETLYLNEEFDAWVKKRTPLGRWGMPTDFVGTAIFLASDAASFITGQIIYIDGGWLATF